MSSFVRISSLCLLGFLLLGCVTASGIRYAEMSPSIPPSDPEQGRIFFYRVTSMGGALKPDIKLNGEVVGEAIAKGFFFLDRPPGNYEVMTSTEVDRKVTFVLEKGQTRFIRFQVSMGFWVGHVYGELVDTKTAMAELPQCRFSGATPGVPSGPGPAPAPPPSGGS